MLPGVEDAVECGVVGVDGVGRGQPAGHLPRRVFVGEVVVVARCPVLVDDFGDCNQAERLWIPPLERQASSMTSI